MAQSSPHLLPEESTGATLYYFGQPSYPFPFRSSEERPQFNVQYRWWEDEAPPMLWGFDIEEIRRVIRYGLYPDEQLPRMALQSRSAATVEKFLLGLAVPQERALLIQLPHIQKVEEILHRCRAVAPPLIAWSWVPTRMDSELDPLAVANAIDTESHLQFARISFEELVRYALGYPSLRVEWFLQQHAVLYALLLDHLNAFPEERVRYLEVEHHLRIRSPFTHRAVAYALRDTGVQVEMASTEPGFGFIAAPIQRLFRDLPQNLTSILKVLCMLGVRFERTYLHSREMKWSQPFSIVFFFLEDILDSASSTDFARTLTTTDEREFAGLVDQGTFDEKLAHRLSVRWETLSIEVWECCRALPKMIEYVQESLQPLLVDRNYHSLTAILSGLHRYSVSESTIVRADNGSTALATNPMFGPEFQYLIDPAQNYATYRQQYNSVPGIPFLIPHLNEHRELGEGVFQILFQQLKSAIPQRG
ncbi:hypothetical protein BJY01DRAFT_238432 [Aspergillus pseudoustus]|uniref:Ras-GEF domain-containing protein n=1 Tax=Aspergillus pseudoustus TaxID=1810923 RepID=A0ABR4J837_9EURO